MISINGYNIQLILNGYEYTSGDLKISSISIYELVQNHLPIIEITCMMPEVKLINFIASSKVTGQLIVNRRDGNDESTIVRLPIRYYSMRGNSNLRDANTVLNFTYDSNLLWDSYTKAITGTSTSVFKELGVENKFSTTIVSSASDSMTWINPNQRGLTFFNNVCDAAWHSSSSCFQWCIRANNSLIFRDISRKDAEQLQKTAYLISGSKNIIEGYYVESNTVAFNRLYGYGKSSYTYNLGNNSLDMIQKVEIKPEGSQSTIMPEANQGSFRVPANYGNTHENYQRAILQNRRLKSTYGTSIMVSLLNDNTDIQLLDDVVIVNNSDSNSLLNNLHGVVSRRVLTIDGNSARYTLSIETNAFNAKDV